jgi:hypothetical protein
MRLWIVAGVLLDHPDRVETESNTLRWFARKRDAQAFIKDNSWVDRPEPEQSNVPERRAGLIRFLNNLAGY